MDDSTPPKRRLLISAVTNWLAFAATLLVAFFLTPYLVRTLGDERYGVWVYAESILAYFTLFDLGIAACVVRFVARFHAARNLHELNRMASSCLALFVGLGAMVLLLGALLTPLLVRALSSPEVEDAGSFLLLMLANLAVTLPLSIFPSVLDGLERFAAKSAVRITFLALRTAAIVVLMETGPSLWGLGIVYTVCNLAEHTALAVLAFVHLPGLRFSWRLIDRATLRLVRGYSADAFLAMVAGRVTVQSAPVVIGAFLSLPQVTFFGIALRLVEFAKALLRSATTTLTPAVSSLEAGGDLGAVRRMLLNGTRWVLYLILPIHLGLVIFGRPFLAVWMRDPEFAVWCYPALVILSGTLSLGVAQSVASRVLYGMGLLKLFARVALLEAALNLGLSLLLVRRYGIEGVAFAAALPNLLFCVFVIGYACRVLGISAGAYLSAGWARPLAAALVPAALWLGLADEIDGWLDFAGALACGLGPYAVVVLALEGGAQRLRGGRGLGRVVRRVVRRDAV